MRQSKRDMRAIRGRRAMIWYDDVSTHMAQIIDALDGSSPGLRALEAAHLYDGGDDDSWRVYYHDGLRELGAGLPAGPWDI